MEETVAVGGMTNVVNQLTTGITSSTIFGVVADVMPFVITLVPIALGLYFLRKLVKGSSHGKVKF